MSSATATSSGRRPPGPVATAIAYARGAAGALIVALPSMLMIEMWWGGFLIPAGRLVPLLVVNFGILYILQHYSGLNSGNTRGAELRAAAAAYGIGLVVSAATLAAMNIIYWQVDARDLIGKLVLAAVPVSIGASVARSNFGDKDAVAQQRKEGRHFWGAMAIALAGAMFFGFGVAVTEEALILGLRTTFPHAVTLVVASIALSYVIVFTIEFRKRAATDKRRWWRLLIRESVGSYVVALVVAAFLLWTFGRIHGGVGLSAAIDMIVTLGFVTNLGAAAGELII